MTILIVDDNEQNRYQLEGLLRGNGHQTVSAANGRNALEAARRDPPELVITDILMPVMDGFVLCREWKSDERLRRIPFIFYTATYTDERDREFALGLGADAFVVKPEEPEAFLRTILNVMQRVRNQPAAPGQVPMETPEEKPAYLKRYNEALIRRLEAKTIQLEKANRELEYDIAERKRSEKRLEESEERFRSLIESAPEGIFVQSEWRFVYLNPAILDMFGAARAEDLLGAEIVERIAPEYRDIVRERLRLQHETGKPVPLMEQDYLRLDGSRVSVETTAMPLRYEGRDAYVVFIRDITERKKMEEEKLRLETQLRQVQKLDSIGKLAGGIAHDFNNILMVQMGYCDLVQKGLTPKDPLRKDIVQIRECAERAAGLTRQLLAFSRKQTLQPEILDLNAVVTHIEKMLRRLIGEDIDFVTVLSDHLGRVRADRGQIEQALTNLAVNARDAMPRGGKLTLVTANVDLDGDYAQEHVSAKAGPHVMIAISDTGCGMDEKTQSRLFEPFFTTKEKGKGTGLGLATTYGIVKQSGGNIWAYSEPGKGSTFKILLPRAEGEPVTRVARKVKTPRGDGELILVVEDEPALRELFTRMIEDLGYRVKAAANGAEALTAVENEGLKPDLLITDVVMPGMGGRVLADHLRRAQPDLKVLYTSGYTDDAIVHHGVLDAGTPFLQKPFSTHALAAKVRQLLDAGKEGAEEALSILMIDDDENLRGLMARACAQRGHGLIGVGTEAEAVEASAGRSFDVLLVDVNLPGSDGIRVLSRMREAGNSTPAILFSGDTASLSAESLRQLGVVKVLEKSGDMERRVDDIEAAARKA